MKMHEREESPRGEVEKDGKRGAEREREEVAFTARGN